jgi:DNA invertase Pin-like site-specific DNA recombinase
MSTQSAAEMWRELPRYKGKVPDPARRALVAKLYEQGYTIRAIAEALAVSYQNVHKLLEKAGVPRRPRGGNTGNHSRHRRS